MEGPRGVLEGAREGPVIVDTNTVSPGASIKLAAAAGRQGIRFVEAPMSGSTPEAESEQLVVLAGGTEADIAFAKPVLDVIARTVIHAGSRLLSKDLGLLLADAARHGVPMGTMTAGAQLFALATIRHADEDDAPAIGALEEVVRR